MRATTTMLVATCWLVGCSSAASRKIGGALDLQPADVVRSGQRAVVRGSVTRRCPLHDAPESDFPLAVFLSGREAPIGKTVSGPDGSFVLTTEYVDQVWTTPILQVGEWRIALPGDADGSYEAKLVVDCDTGEPYLPGRRAVRATATNLTPP